MPDTIVFADIPTNLRLPGAYVSVDPSRAANAAPTIPRKVLLLGQRLSSGAVAANVPYRVNSADDAALNSGIGSMLHRMALSARAAAPMTDLWAVGLADDAAGVAATGTLVVAGPATAAGVIYLYIAGQRLTVAVAASAAASAIATAVAAAINAMTSLPVTASVSTATVTLTCRWKGTTGNAIDVRLNYYQGERLPAGVTVTITALASGATDPDPTNALVAIAGEWFYSILTPYTGATFNTVLDPDLADRWGPLDPRPAHVFRALSGTHGALTTYGEARNSIHYSTLGLRGVPTPPWEVAAAWGAAVDARAANTDPLHPFVGVPIPGMLAPAIADRFSQVESNNLSYSGISTYTIDRDGACRVGLVLTEYQTNSLGVEDISLLYLNHKWGADLVRYVFRAWAAGLIAQGFKLSTAPNALKVAGVIDMQQLRALSYPVFRELEALGIVQDFDQYKRDVRFEISVVDPTRVNAVLPPQLLSPLHVIAAAVQFRL